MNSLSFNPTKWSNIQAIRRLLLTNCLSVFDHFVELALTGLMFQPSRLIKLTYGSLTKYITLNSKVTVNRKNINWTAMKLTHLSVSPDLLYAFYPQFIFFGLGFIHLVSTQSFPKNEHFLHPDTHT